VVNGKCCPFSAKLLRFSDVKRESITALIFA
jgi:hypothetical protein